MSDLFIEINASDGDVGLQLQLEGEKWNTSGSSKEYAVEVLAREASGNQVITVRAFRTIWPWPKAELEVARPVDGVEPVGH
jgi:hypothetical protein